jgi:hypothetical protein
MALWLYGSMKPCNPVWPQPTALWLYSPTVALWLYSLHASLQPYSHAAIESYSQQPLVLLSISSMVVATTSLDFTTTPL